MQESVIADFHEPCGQYVLKKAAQKFHDIQGHGAPPVAFIFTVFEKDFSIFDFNDPAIRNSHFKHIGSEVFDTVFAGTDGLAVNDPLLIPDIGRDFVIKSVLFHNVAEFGLEDFRHGPDRQKKIDSRAVPFPVGF